MYLEKKSENNPKDFAKVKREEKRKQRALKKKQKKKKPKKKKTKTKGLYLCRWEVSIAF